MTDALKKVVIISVVVLFAVVAVWLGASLGKKAGNKDEYVERGEED